MAKSEGTKAPLGDLKGMSASNLREACVGPINLEHEELILLLS